MNQPPRVTLHAQIQQLRREIQRLVDEERTYDQSQQPILEERAKAQREELVLDNDIAALTILSQDVTDLTDQQFQGRVVSKSWHDCEKINDRDSFGAAVKVGLSQAITNMRATGSEFNTYPRAIPLTVEVGDARWDASLSGSVEGEKNLTVMFSARDTISALNYETPWRQILDADDMEVSRAFERELESVPSTLNKMKQHREETYSRLREVEAAIAPWPGRDTLDHRCAQLEQVTVMLNRGKNNTRFEPGPPRPDLGHSGPGLTF